MMKITNIGTVQLSERKACDQIFRVISSGLNSKRIVLSPLHSDMERDPEWIVAFMITSFV